MNQRVDHVAGLEDGSLGNVLQPQFIEGRILGQRRALEVKQVLDLDSFSKSPMEGNLGVDS
jgi:hypothetical protein